jgi:hypothetical protein
LLGEVAVKVAMACWKVATVMVWRQPAFAHGAKKNLESFDHEWRFSGI